ncbi:hydroxyacid dehydrogenase [Halobacteriales archaeon SW_7_65_23]|nr:MAG: hydroxyacid dehydrogenase [Halobacteriales archaeon SW_7_65_23]
MSGRQILVLRQKIHGTDAEVYRDELAQRLPDHDVILARTPDEERDALRTASVATGLTLSPADLEDADNLELFACVFAGTDHLELDAFEEHGVAVTNASGVHRANMSEYTVGAMVALSRQFPRAWRQKQSRTWQSYPVRELQDSTAVVVGMGAIGQAVVSRLDAFGVDTVGVRYSPEKGGPTDETYGFDEIHEAVAEADYVIVACRLTEATEGLIDADVLMTVPSDAFLINVARGPVVDTEALVDAFRTNDLGGAALDVTDPEPLPADHPLWTFENVMITPHNAGNTPEYFARRADILAENVAALDADDDLTNRVV